MVNECEIQRILYIHSSNYEEYRRFYDVLRTKRYLREAIVADCCKSTIANLEATLVTYLVEYQELVDTKVDTSNPVSS